MVQQFLSLPGIVHEVRLVPTLPRSTLEKVAKAELRAQLAADR
jgi:hypothetical protein